jgi:hypothetical protein
MTRNPRQSKAKSKPRFGVWGKRLNDWFSAAQSIYGFWLALGGASVTGYFGITGDVPPFIILVTCISFLIGISLAFSLGKSQRQRNVFALGIGIVCAGVFAYSLRLQHIHEKREFLDYHPTYAGMAMDIDVTPPAEGRKAKVRIINLAVTFDNPNSFPIYVKSVRRYITVGGKGSGDEQEPVFIRWPEFSQDSRIADSDIHFHPYLDPPGRYLEGTIDYTVCFGREEGKFDKHFNMRGKLIFRLRASGGFLRCPTSILPMKRNGHSATLRVARVRCS